MRFLQANYLLDNLLKTFNMALDRQAGNRYSDSVIRGRLITMQWLEHLIDKGRNDVYGVRDQIMKIEEWLGHARMSELICEWGNWPLVEVYEEGCIWVEATQHWLKESELLAFIRWLYAVNEAEGFEP